MIPTTHRINYPVRNGSAFSQVVQKANDAVKMYRNVGFKTVDENAEEFIMVCEV